MNPCTPLASSLYIWIPQYMLHLPVNIFAKQHWLAGHLDFQSDKHRSFHTCPAFVMIKNISQLDKQKSFNRSILIVIIKNITAQLDKYTPSNRFKLYVTTTTIISHTCSVLNFKSACGIFSFELIIGLDLWLVYEISLLILLHSKSTWQWQNTEIVLLVIALKAWQKSTLT